MSRIKIPAASEIQCPLGHPVEFRTLNAYSSRNSVCDLCELNLNRKWSQGVYHCTVDRCTSTVLPGCSGWDICVDCAVRQALHRQALEDRITTHPNPSDRKASLLRGPASVTALLAHSDWARLPYDVILCIVAFVGQDWQSTLTLVSRTLFHVVGVANDDALHLCGNPKCCQPSTGWKTPHRLPQCKRCSAVFHGECVLGQTTCPACHHPLVPGTEQEHRVIFRECPVCEAPHRFLLPPSYYSFSVTNSGFPELLDGIYHVSPMPSDGVPIWLGQPREGGTTLPALYRQEKRWVLGTLGETHGKDHVYWQAPTESPSGSTLDETAPLRWGRSCWVLMSNMFMDLEASGQDREVVKITRI